MKGLLLLSGGIDSPVAGYLMKKQGVELNAVHFDNQPFTDGKPVDIATRLAKKIGVKKLFIVDYGKAKSEIVKNCTRRFTCVLCRRLMFKISEAIANQHSYDFLVTGENIGQVASQTLPNMVAEHSATKIKVLRPILCNDKQETINLAKEIDTFDISTEPSICCTLVPDSPATKSKIFIIEREESQLNVDEIVKESCETAKVIKIE